MATDMLNGALCANGAAARSRAWIAPDKASPSEITGALVCCFACPVQVACARQALAAGTWLDAPKRLGDMAAVSVVQGGVICDGSAGASRALAAVGGMPIPKARRLPSRSGTRCKACGRVMVSWSRSGPAPGEVMHYARGYCNDCRAAYRRARRNSPLPISERGEG